MKAQHLLDVIARHLGADGRMRALDVGCGTGLLHRYLAGALDLHGVDVAPEMVAVARETNPGVGYDVADGARLPYNDGVFDLAFCACVLHHVPPPKRVGFVREARRVVRPGGLVVVFEHNPLNPLTRLAVARCAFDEDAVLLTRGETLRTLETAGLQPEEDRYFLVFPWRHRVLGGIERGLARLPLGAQYYAAARRTG